MPLTIVSKSVKYSGIDLTRNAYSLYKEKYTTFLMLCKERLKKRCTVFLKKILNHKNSVLLKLIYKFNAIIIKILMEIFKLILKFIEGDNIHKDSQETLKKTS